MTEYRLEVPDQLWKEFKESLNKTETLNEAIVELLKQEVEHES